MMPPAAPAVPWVGQATNFYSTVLLVDDFIWLRSSSYSDIPHPSRLLPAGASHGSAGATACDNKHSATAV
jgi:hypothetical protein